MVQLLTYKFRIKSGDRWLRRHAVDCNQVWNYCVNVQKESERKWKAGKKIRWPTHFDLNKLTRGLKPHLNLHSDTVNAINRQFTVSRDTRKKVTKFRTSYGAKRNLGWVPYSARALEVSGNQVTYLKRRYTFWKSREIIGTIKTGAFVEDSRGRWYVTFQCEVSDDLPIGEGQVGIDLGLKDLATLSDGTKIDAPKFFRKYEAELAVQQRAGNKKRVRAIHAKIKNARAHHLHVASTAIVRNNSFIAVGNVNAAGLGRTKMAKSIYDAGWSAFRHMLRYKARRHGAVFMEVDERWSTQTCSCCGSNPASSPKGRAGLGIRHWECSDCAASHDRDINAARNILRVGLEHQPPAEETAAR